MVAEIKYSIMNKEISVEKVASHKFHKKSKSSVWIIIHNTVYDVTKFLKEVGVLKMK